MDWYGYWPFMDPSLPNDENNMPAYVIRPVTTRVGNEITTIDMPVPCFYL